MTRKVLISGAPDWWYTRPVSKAFLDLWPATHELYCDMRSGAGRIAYDRATLYEFKVHTHERVDQWLDEYDYAYIFDWIGELDGWEWDRFARTTIMFATRRPQQPSEQAQPPET